MNKINGDREPQPAIKDGTYDSGTIKVVVFACVIIVLAVVLTGSVGYFITRDAVVDKLKSRDLVYALKSITSKIDGRVERAKETALILSQDPTIIQWVASAEADERLGEYSRKKINDIAQNYDYANSFIVSAITKHYWAEGSKLIQVMSETSPHDKWFYDMLQSDKAVDLNIDYNTGRQDTYVFVNALVKDGQRPVAVTGVGLSLKSIAAEFQRYKAADRSNLWLVDSEGKIHLADDFSHNGRYLNDFLPTEVCALVVQDMDRQSTDPKVIEYTAATGETMDLAYQSTKSTDWKVVFQVPRSESIALLDSIKLNAAIAGLLTLVLMIFVFYFVSYRIADPLKRALRLTKEMERQVEERTRELSEKNQKIVDSIDYAKRLQESILATPAEISAIFNDYFILWQPRDIVGGDFYWVRPVSPDKSLVAVGDCTGHGVPGAFMTMAVNSVLKHIVDQDCTEPAQILAELNRRLKEILHRNRRGDITDDGLDIGICCINHKQRQLVFAGAKIPLFIYRDSQVHILKGDRQSIGYRRSNPDMQFTAHCWNVKTGDRFYLTTDGYTDQNGGSKDYSFGRKRLTQLILEQDSRDLSEQQAAFIAALREYMGREQQRDDIAMIGFSCDESRAGAG
ncbi:SpoIIE family protein phosphatase [Sporomusa aerivorans]|uniref:SpoIIE family protein phosphatase n=1 Tax=Sporomusa aerivorans TaxID=204936 RepID=UPI00352B0DB6